MFNASYPRRSADLGVYVEDAGLSEIADGDVAALRSAGFTVKVDSQFYGLVVEAQVSREGQSTLVEWTDSDRERFFPVIEDAVFGWVLDPVDLAVQKLVAAATRRAARDVVDVLLLNLRFASLAALAIAAPAKLAGSSPTSILDRVLRNGIGHPQQDYSLLALDESVMPFKIGRTKDLLADAVDCANEEITQFCDQAEVGFVYVVPGTKTPQVPRNDRLAMLQRHGISQRGLVPIVGRMNLPQSGTSGGPDRT